MDLFGSEEEFVDGIDAAEDEAAPNDFFSSPRNTQLLLGHEDHEQNLLKLYADGTLPHALVFSGPKGIGKATLAYRLIRFLLKNGIKDKNQDSLFGDAPQHLSSLDVPADDPVSRRIASGAYPDFFSIERAFDETKGRMKTGVDVHEIRKVPPFLRMTASEGGWRIVLIDDADTMNRNAQNALLKILEEPPRHSLLILITHRLGALIPTIRSRVRVMEFATLNSQTMKSLFMKGNFGLSAKEEQSLINLSEGSLGKALRYQEEGALQTLERIMESFKSYPRWNWAELHKMAEDFGRYGQENTYALFEELMISIFSLLARQKGRGQALDAAWLEGRAFQDIYRNSSLEQLLKICENLSSHFSKIQAANLDKRQGVLGAFSIIA